MPRPELTPEARAALDKFVTDYSDPRYTANMDQALASGGKLLTAVVDEYLRLRDLVPEPIAFRIMSSTVSGLDRIGMFALITTAVHRLAEIHTTVTDAAALRDTHHKEN